MKFDWKGVVSKLAPTIAGSVGGPFAAMATKTLSEAILGKPDGTMDEVEKVLITDPDAMLKLKVCEANFETKLKELDVDFAKINADDRNSARQRQITLKDKTPAVLAGVAFSGFFGILGVMIFMPIPESSQAPLNIMLGSLGTIVVSITNFFFGSSSGSKKKTDMFHSLRK